MAKMNWDRANQRDKARKADRPVFIAGSRYRATYDPPAKVEHVRARHATHKPAPSRDPITVTIGADCPWSPNPGKFLVLTFLTQAAYDAASNAWHATASHH